MRIVSLQFLLSVAIFLAAMFSLSLVSCGISAVPNAPIGAAAGSLTGATVEQSTAGVHNSKSNGGYPTATAADRKYFVVSPYAPYHEIDVKAFRRHALVRDPSCNRIFVNL